MIQDPFIAPSYHLDYHFDAFLVKHDFLAGMSHAWQTADFDFMDEPTNGLDPSGIHEIWNLIKSLSDLYNCTVLISFHMLSEIQLMADHIGILNHGRLLFEGSLEELRQNALRHTLFSILLCGKTFC